MNDFRAQLRELILDKANGLILDAWDHRDADGVISQQPDSAFYFAPLIKGQAGSTRRYYLTIAGLFRDPEKNLNRCLDALAESIERFSKAGEPVDYLITASVTGRYLAEYVLPRMTRSDRQEIRTLGLSMDQDRDLNLEFLKDQRCVIVCDVIAGGSQIRSVVEKLKHAKAKLLGCVAVVDTGEQTPDPRIGTPLRTLTSMPIDDIPCSDDSLPNLIPVTPGLILNRLIGDKRNRMLLGPEVTRKADGTLDYSEKKIFRRASGGYQHQFVTLWPLFENLLCFEDCMDHLANTAASLRAKQETHYSTIVTCTATGRHLLEHLQPRIENTSSVEAMYLGPYPYHALTKLPDNAFKGKSVLIVTDVIASQTLVKNIASVIHRLDGGVAAVLAMVTTLSKEEDWKPEIEYAPGRTVRIESLCTFGVKKVTALPKGFTAIDIDPETILPREEAKPSAATLRDQGPGVFEPFDLATTLRHFDVSGAIRMGIFEAGNRYFSAGIRLPMLFERFGREIWNRIDPAFKDKNLLVTTTDRDDLRFLDFVQRWAEPNHPGLGQLVIARYDSLEFDFPYFLPEQSRQQLIGKRVVVLIHSAQTAEKLRRLVSLLAQSPIASVDVICLLNRMGDHLADFVARIKQMASGVGGGGGREHPFNFHWVYSVNDLNGNQLLSTWESIQRLIDTYSKNSRSPVFRHLASEELRYFRLHSFHNRSIESEAGKLLPQVASIAVGENTIELTRLDSWLYAWFAHDRSLDKRHAEIRKLLVEQDERSSTYSVLVFILAEISYLRSRKRVKDIKADIAKAIESRRNECRDLEDSLGPVGESDDDEGSPQDEAAFLRISALVMEQTALYFSLALICYLDDGPAEASADLYEIATNGFTEEQWKRYPLNFQAYFDTSRTLWCVSLLLFFAHLEKALTNAAFQRESQKLVGFARQYQILISGGKIPFRPQLRESRQSLARRLAYAFDALLMDLGEHQLATRDSVLIFLHNRVGLRAHHNALCKDVKEALTLISHLRRETSPDREVPLQQPVSLPSSGTTASARERALSRKWKSAVDKAVSALAILQLVGVAAGEMFVWYRLAPKDEEKRFHDPPQKSLFQEDIELIYAELSRVRRDGQLSSSQYGRLDQAYLAIEHDLVAVQSGATGAPTTLRKAVDYYQPPIRKTIIDEMKSADDWLRNEYGPIWSEKAIEFEIESEQSTEYFVLADPVLLKEILWNLFTNVRHGLKRLADGGDVDSNARNVRCRLTPETAVNPGTRPRVHFEVVSALGGSRTPGAADTLFRHQQDIKLYGGNLDFHTEDQITVKVSLDLIRMKEAARQQ